MTKHDREDDRDLLLGLQHRFDRAQRPLHDQRRLPGALQIDGQLDRLLLRRRRRRCLVKPERLARERREAGDLGPIAARRDDAARGRVRLAIDVEVEAHDARVPVQVAEQLLFQVAVVRVGRDALQILGDVVGQLLGATSGRP